MVIFLIFKSVKMYKYYKMVIDKCKTNDTLPTNTIQTNTVMSINNHCNKELTCKKKYKQRINEHELTYSNFIGHKLDVTRYLISDIKKACILCNEKRSGTKQILIGRLLNKYEKITKCIKIQSVFRGFYTRLNLSLRGSGFKEVTICNNNTDFCTLEPLNEIKFPYFFSYKDDAGFIYGFNIISLISVYKRNHKIMNPYNRNIFPSDVLKNVFIIYHSNFVLYNNFKQTHITDFLASLMYLNPTQHKKRIYNNRRIRQCRMRRLEHNPYYNDKIITLNANRRLDYDARMREVFIQVFSYDIQCDHSWVISLTPTILSRLYRLLYFQWINHNILEDTKRKICFLTELQGSPFKIGTRLSTISNLSEQALKEELIYTMENMVFTGFNDEYQKIGAFHLMTALTCVSADARNALPYLYESTRM